MGKYIYGIDFGTSNSVLAILDLEKRSVIHVLSESSLIYFQDASARFVGNDAIEKYLSNNMSGRLLKSIKTLLPQSNFTFTYIYGKKYTAEDLVAIILNHLKAKADQLIGEDVTEVVLGRPVVFSENQDKDKLAQTRLIRAARNAGFENILIQYEPIAAGYLYEQTLTAPETVLIGDFGGGTSDFTLMKLDKKRIEVKDRKEDILKTGGLHIGGDDLDAAIMWNRLVPYFGYGVLYDSYGKMLPLPVHIFRTLCEWDQMGFLKEGKIRKSLDTYYTYTKKDPSIRRLMTLIDHNLGYSLYREIEKTKVALSKEEGVFLKFNKMDIDIEEKIQESTFEEMTSEEIQSIGVFLDKFLESAGVSEAHIDKVFLTGGTSLARPVQQLFSARFAENKLSHGDNFNSVALGLALSYFYLQQE